jgi:SEC-C motif-containing protein
MRSRYSAFALQDKEYLQQTWHPTTRPRRLTLEPGQRWTGLDIITTTGGSLFDTEGTVEFQAHYTDRYGPQTLHERSRFVREGGRWLYTGPTG